MTEEIAMRWMEVALDTPTEKIETRCLELEALGCTGFVIENEEDFKNFIKNNRQYWGVVDGELAARFEGVSRIKFYLSDDADGRAVLDRVRAAYGEPAVSYIQDSDWENNWRQYYKPLEIGKKLVVVPEWESVPEDGRIPLWLEPGLIFGTGDHPTTRLCLEGMEEWAGPGKRVLDLGCGSGILGIAALLLGCESCLGVDIDPMAPEVAAGNAALNGLGGERFRVLCGDLLNDEPLRKSLGTDYDMVLANIVADVIIPISALVRRFMAPGGVFIVSGIIGDRAGETASALKQNGFEIVSRRFLNDWHSFTCI
jgi:ribosomal protein L11 methyltransferase